MIEAYKIILRENGSVRRAEALARRYKNKLTYEKPAKLFLSLILKTMKLTSCLSD